MPAIENVSRSVIPSRISSRENIFNRRRTQVIRHAAENIVISCQNTSILPLSLTDIPNNTNMTTAKVTMPLLLP